MTQILYPSLFCGRKALSVGLAAVLMFAALVAAFPLAYAAPADEASLESRAPAKAGQGQGGIVVAAIKLVLDATGPNTLTDITLHSSGTALTGADIAALRLWNDDNKDGVPQGTELLATLTGAQNGETYTFSLNLDFPDAVGTFYLLVTVDLAANAIVGRTVQFSFTATDNVIVDTNPVAVIGSTSPMTITTTPAGFLTAKGYTGKDTQSSTASDNVLVRGATVGLSIVKLAATGAAVNVTKIKAEVTASISVEHVVSELKIYLDDGSFDPTTNPGGGFGSEVAGSWSAWSPTGGATTTSRELTITGGLVIPAGTSKVLHIAAVIKSDAPTSATVEAYVPSSGGVWSGITAKSPDSIVVAGEAHDPYAGTISDKGKLTVAVADSGDISTAPVRGQPAYSAMKLTLTPMGEPMEVKSIKVTLNSGGGNTFVPADILRVRLFEATPTGAVNKSAEIPTVQGPWSDATSSASTTLTLSKTITKQTIIHVAFDISTNADTAHRLSVGIASGGDIVAKGSISKADISSTGTGSTSLSSNVIAKGTLTVTLDTSIPASGTFVTIGSTRFMAVKLTFAAADEDVVVEKLKLTLPNVGPTSGVPADIAAIKLYNSTLVDGRLTYEIPTVAGSWVGTTHPYSIELTISGGYKIPKGGSKVVYVGVDIASAAGIGHNIKLGIADVAHVTAKGVWSGVLPTITLLGNYPNNVFTIQGKLTVTGVNQVAPGSSVSLGQSRVPMLKLSFTALGEAMTITDLAVTLTGISTSADIATNGVKLFEDAAGAPGTLIAQQSISGSTASFTALSISVPAATTKIIHVTYDIASAAVPGHTVGASISSATAVKATGATSGNSDIRPSDFTAISSELATITTGVTLSYVTGSLSPTWATANTTQATFTIKVTKGGDPGLRLDPTRSYITLTDGFVVFTAYLAEATTIPAGDTGTTQFTLTFRGNIPNIREYLSPGYDVTMRLQGVDTNGASYDSTPLTLIDKIRIDNTPPTITHTPVAEANANAAVAITATVTDQTGGSGVNMVTLYYRKIGTAWSSTLMALVGTNTYSATIPAAVVAAPGVEYYIRAVDNAGVSRATTTYTIQVILPDTTPPTIEHTPVTTALVNTPIVISATITDNVAVSSATLYYRVVGAATWSSAAMTAVGNVYSATIPAAAVTTAGVEYYITAVDTTGNTARTPATGAYTITVTTYSAPASPPTRVDPVTGAPLPAQVSAGSAVGASVTVTNLAARPTTVRIFFTVELEGVPLLYGSSTVTLAAGQAFEAVQGWILTQPGTYTIRITVTDAATGISLSEERAITYTVVG